MKEQWSEVYIENFKNILVNYCEEKSGFVTGRIYYLESENTTISTSKEEFKESGNEEKQRYVTAIKGSAVFKEDKLIGWIDGIETRSYMLIKNKAKNGIITADYNNGKESLSFTFRKSKRIK